MQSPYLIIAVLALPIASLVLGQVNQRLASPVVAILDRWLRWLVFAFCTAFICEYLQLVDRPFWALVVVFFLLWFVGETLLNWLSIHALSVSPLPLFPRYVPNQIGDEWPTQRRTLALRDWLRAQGFKQAQAMKAEIGGGIYLRVSIYQSPDAMVRVQMTFIPHSSGAITVCFAAMSMTEDGGRYVTDNLYVPFAGFYPENWFVERIPLCRSLPKVLARHKARMAAAKAAPVPFAVDPMTDVNATQGELERLNTEMGFLHSYQDREDLGKITQAGRYRVWKEIWMLNYLGRAAKYE